MEEQRLSKDLGAVLRISKKILLVYLSFIDIKYCVKGFTCILYTAHVKELT